MAMSPRRRVVPDLPLSPTLAFGRKRWGELRMGPLTNTGSLIEKKKLPPEQISDLPFSHRMPLCRIWDVRRTVQYYRSLELDDIFLC